MAEAPGGTPPRCIRGPSAQGKKRPVPAGGGAPHMQPKRPLRTAGGCVSPRTAGRAVRRVAVGGAALPPSEAGKGGGRAPGAVRARARALARWAR
eukprot:CAMPEP_0204564204 /NCGR_PEP_ID=MMETSP0661-20131031/34753_1 /ASSEMBLY_ACC=CAM_ASM_000606 /TAXON_ID=109239 /ORGANISM="Alexandrium margalefi, Strain AMGDE01CS-322" /LENGTH=94 /DNA_ID=CAMNT_0051571829 /DNA_START=20 /DNA_END=301 /DNA_ORIENTATION=-